jgi:hypothetical protein
VERNLRRRLSVRVEERAYWCLSSRGTESGKKKKKEAMVFFFFFTRLRE